MEVDRIGTLGRKEGGRCTGGGKKGEKKKLRKVAWVAGSLYPHPLSLSVP